VEPSRTVTEINGDLGRKNNVPVIANQCTYVKRTFQRCDLCGLRSTYQMSRIINRVSKPTKNFVLQKFISSIISDVEKFAEFNGRISFLIREKWEEWEIYRQKIDFVV